MTKPKYIGPDKLSGPYNPGFSIWLNPNVMGMTTYQTHTNLGSTHDKTLVYWV